jgi:hypothetical protein
LPGFARHFEKAVNKYPTVRRVWACHKYGVMGSSSADWSPNSCTPHKTAKNLYEYCFGEGGVLQHASVVCVMVGACDACSPESTLQNLCSLGQSLYDAGKVVFVATCPQTRMTKHDKPTQCLIERANQRAALIRQYCGAEDAAFLLGPSIETALPVNSVHYRFGGNYSGSGHKKLGELWAVAVNTTLTRLEWDWFQQISSK